MPFVPLLSIDSDTDELELVNTEQIMRITAERNRDTAETSPQVNLMVRFSNGPTLGFVPVNHHGKPDKTVEDTAAALESLRTYILMLTREGNEG